MELLNAQLLENYGQWVNGHEINFNDNQELANNVDQALNIYKEWILANENHLPPGITPIERHPYIINYPINIKRNKLVIGTMPPISYMADQLDIPLIFTLDRNNITKPSISFFHGNMLSLWSLSSDEELMDSIMSFNEDIMDRENLLEEVVNYLQRNNVSITDIISTCQREAINANDQGLFNIDLNLGIIDSISSEESEIKTLIFTNSVTGGVAGIRIFQNGNRIGQINTTKRDAFSLFLRACQIRNVQVMIRLFENQIWQSVELVNLPWLTQNTSNKIIFYLKLIVQDEIEKEFIVITPPSPSNQAVLGLANNLNRLAFLDLFPESTINEFRREVWNNAMVTDNHPLISTWQ
jgi:hypothetical protein